jgi:hypothetical protein
MKKHLIFLLVLLFGGLSSCLEEQDFDQWDDLDVIPTVDASLIYVESPERIINEAPAMGFYSEDFTFDAFNEAFIQDQIVDALIRYEVDNTTSKPLEFVVELLDAGDAVLDTEIFMIPPAPTPLLIREVFYGPGGRPLDILRNTVTVRLTATNLGDNTSVSVLTDPKILLRSSVRARLRLK